MEAIKKEIQALRGNEIDVKVKNEIDCLEHCEYDKVIIFQCDFYDSGNKSRNAKFLVKNSSNPKIWGYGYMIKGAPQNHLGGVIQVSEMIRKLGL